MTPDPRWSTERQIEVPFLLAHTVGPRVLDVGQDRVGYTADLVARGFHVVPVDPGCDQTRTDGEYACRVQDMPYDCPPFDTALVISTLEHFDWSPENLETAAADIEGLRAIASHVTPEGRILLTVPYGGEAYIDDGFIQWTAERCARVIAGAGLVVRHQEIWLWDGQGQYQPATEAEMDGVRYHYRSAPNAGAVWCGVLGHDPGG